MRGMTRSVVLAMWFAAGCGGSSHNEYCVPGQQQSCTLSGCALATQTCKDDWSGFGECGCVTPAQTDAGLPQQDAALPPDDAETPPDDASGPQEDATPQQDAQQDTLPPCVENQPCNDDNGVCHDGACCEGCWDGTTCRLGTEATACGGDGAACTACGVSATTCAVNVCSSFTRTCVTQPQHEGQACNSECGASGGATCQNGRCRPTNVEECMTPMIKCLGQGTCNVLTTPHLCQGGCCDGLVCGYL